MTLKEEITIWSLWLVIMIPVSILASYVVLHIFQGVFLR